MLHTNSVIAQATFNTRLKKAQLAGALPLDMIFVGWSYLHGYGVKRDTEAAIEWFTRAALLGNAEAQIRLAELYEVGEIVSCDCSKASFWYEQAEVVGGFWAPYARAVSHYFGSNCIELDMDKAYAYFARAASEGHLVSEFQLARLMRTKRFGLATRFRGYLLAARAFVVSAWIVARGVPSDRLWDAQRWMGNSKFLLKIREGTRFE